MEMCLEDSLSWENLFGSLLKVSTPLHTILHLQGLQVGQLLQLCLGARNAQEEMIQPDSRVLVGGNNNLVAN
jgi:hypothetical protein